MKEKSTTINLKNILLSGFVAGLVINLSAISMIPVVGNEMDSVLINLGLSPLSNAAMAYFCFISFIYGMSVTLLYAVFRFHFGSGIKTAIISSVIIFVLAYLIGNTSLLVYGFMPVRLVVTGTIWGLIELLFGGIIGAKLYERRL